MSQSLNRAQIEASDPTASVWVSASAGSGKTHALTDRVLRLLLEGAEPDRILCLTYTRAAAAEMTDRIWTRLAEWATAGNSDLITILTELTNSAPTPEACSRARWLYGRVLDRPLKIQTLHSFCQSLLKRFPLEAGLSPNFEMIDDRSAKDLRAQAYIRSFARADAQNDPQSVKVKHALDRVTMTLSKDDLEHCINAIMNERQALEESESVVPDHTVETTYLEACLGTPLTTAQNDIAAFCAGGDLDSLAHACSVLATDTAGKTNSKRAESLQYWLEDRSEDRLNAYCNSWVKKNSNDALADKSLITAKFAEAHPEILQSLKLEQQRVIAYKQRMAARAYGQLCADLTCLARSVHRDYVALKQGRSLLDFEDLILKTVALLNDQRFSGEAAPMAAWVLYKLDGGLDHLLLDEAQDTNPDQWKIVAALLEEFLSGAATDADGKNGKRDRSLFVVGDEKQSIYGFQRADAAEFARMRSSLSEQIVAAGQNFRNRELTISYRSVAAILNVVDAVFNQEKAREGVVATGRTLRHIAHRAEQGGVVELWPLAPYDASDKPDAASYWQANQIASSTQEVTGQIRLAAGIAGQIKCWLDSEEQLEGRGRPITPGDILILVRKRSSLAQEIIKALEGRGVPVSGLDRLTLLNDIAVCDLLSALRFSLLPADDLALAELLKSPLMGFEEGELFELAWDRETRWGEITLFGALRSAAQTCTNIALRERVAASVEWLDRLLARTDFLSPHDLMTAMLQEPCPADPVSGRRAFAARLGRQSWEPLAELLNLALVWSRDHATTTQGFLAWLEGGETEIKREAEASGPSLVRLMTVHGSKGLQSPIVILPDTLFPTAQLKGMLWPHRLCPEAVSKNPKAAALPWWIGRQDHRTAIPFGLAEAERKRVDEEQHRLLYVAMTRAADRLIICGHLGKNQKDPTASHMSDNWYGHVQIGMESLDSETFEFNSQLWGLPPEQSWQGEALRVRSVQQASAIELKSKPESKPVTATMQQTPIDIAPPNLSCLLHPAAPDPSPPTPLNPSRMDAALQVEPVGLSPLLAVLSPAGSPHIRFRRGLLIHKLLQTLAGQPSEHWQQLGNQTLALHLGHLGAETSSDVTVREAEEALNVVISVLSNPEFSELFGPNSRGEVPIVGQCGTHLISGRIDRLAILEDKILMVDYKTNRPAAQCLDDVPRSHLVQLAAYRTLLQGLWPDKPIKSAVLWTEGPHLMPIPEESLKPFVFDQTDSSDGVI